MENAKQKRAIRIEGAIARGGRDLSLRSLRTLCVSSPVYRIISKLKSWLGSDFFTIWALLFILSIISISLAISVALYMTFINIVYTDPDQTTSLNKEAT